jgi:hypothetical protein
MNNAPLKELLEIAKSNQGLATKIADDFPVSGLNYDVLITFYPTGFSSQRELLEKLIDKILPCNFKLDTLLEQFKNSEYYEVRYIAAKLLTLHFSESLSKNTMLEICETSNSFKPTLAPLIIDKHVSELACEQLFEMYSLVLPEALTKKINDAILALPKEGLDIEVLKNQVINNWDSASHVASVILLEKFESELDLAILIYIMKSTDAEVLQKVTSLIENYPKDKIDFREMFDFQSDPNEKVREAATYVADLIPVECLSAGDLLKFLASSDDDVVSLAYMLLTKIPGELISRDKLLVLSFNGPTSQRNYALRLLLLKFSDELPYQTLAKLFDSSSEEETREDIALLILHRFHDTIELELLEKMKAIGIRTVRMLRLELIKKNQEKLIQDANEFFKKHNL